MIYKKDVYLSLCLAIVALGKNNIPNCKEKIQEALTQLEQWEKDRPERTALRDRGKL